MPPLKRKTKPRTRRCTRCSKRRPIDDFFLDHRTGSPRSWCKACTYAYSRRYRRRNLDRVRARDRRYYRKHKAAQAARQKRPDVRAKRAVRQAVYWAVRTGILHRPDRCEHCGRRPPPHRLHAHHADYSRPLDVTWLCSLCHGQVHTQSTP